MPLPPALLKRLSSRGIINADNQSQQTVQNTENEEIIAEDYDDIEDPLQYDYEPIKKPEKNFWIERMKKRITEGNSQGYKGCPNKYNIFHKCTLYCINRWGEGTSEPTRAYLKRHNRLLKRYPLPKIWTEVYDSGCGVYYYWNIIDDTVSWLPPDHPKSEISKSAAALRRELDEIEPQDEEINIDNLTEQDIHKILEAPTPPVHSTGIKRPFSPSSTDSTIFTTLKKSKSRNLDKAIRQKASRKSDKIKTNDSEPLDPMDPAAYSDIPRGKWSDGLNTENIKTGVDPTITGALFQMRPYPSPGTVLQANTSSSSSKTCSGKSRKDE